MFDEADVARLLADSAIVRHRGKIEAVIINARKACQLIDTEESLAAFIWLFEPSEDELASSSPASIRLSKELKKRGWKFVGPSTVYAFMQAIGLINDHAEGCFQRDEVRLARRKFAPPN